MKAIRYDGTRLELVGTAPAPVAEPGEAVIRPVRMAVGTQDTACSMGGVTPPITLGQEFVGVVQAVQGDAEVRKRWEGKRVVGSANIACTRCDLCRAGLANHCRARRTMGVTGWDGCFAESFKLPIRNLVEVPKELDDERAVFAASLAGAAHAAQLIRVEGKPYVTVLGDNASALLCAQVMARLNASVRLLGADPAKIVLCEKWGIKHRHVSEPGRRADQDIVVDASAAGLGLALQFVRPRGTIVLLGRAGADCPSLAPLVEREIGLIGARGGNLPEAVAMLARGEIDVLPLVTKRLKLADGVAALRAGAEPEHIKVVLEP